MTCPKCKSELPEDLAFCIHCGAKLNASTSENTLQTTPRPTFHAEPEPQEKKLNKLAILALILGIIPFTAPIGFVIAVVAMFIIDANRERQTGLNMVVAAGMLSVLSTIFLFAYIANMFNH